MTIENAPNQSLHPRCTPGAGQQCTANQLVNSAGDGCISNPTVQNIDSNCANNKLITDEDATIGVSTCGSAVCTQGQAIYLGGATPECKDLKLTLLCDTCTPNTGACGTPSPSRVTWDGSTAIPLDAGDCDVACATTGDAIGQCNLLVSYDGVPA